MRRKLENEKEDLLTHEDRDIQMIREMDVQAYAKEMMRQTDR